jgi:hypothetical protein
MEIQIVEKQPVFVPIKIMVTLETVDEAKEFIASLNPIKNSTDLLYLKEKMKNTLKERGIL